MDENLTLAKKPEAGTTVLHWQGKFRGLEFAPFHFRFEIVASPSVVDSKDRKVQLPVLRPSSPDDAAQQAEAAAHRDIAILRAIVANPKATIRNAGLTTGTSKSAIERRMTALSKSKSIEKDLLYRWQLTKSGAEKLSKISVIDDP